MALPDQAPDPHGMLAWANAVIETIKQAYVALIVPTAAAVAWIVKIRSDGREKAQKRADERRQNEEDAHQRIAEQLDRDSAARFIQLRDEAAVLRASLAEREADVNRLMGLVRQWYDIAHDMRHEAGRMLQRYRLVIDQAKAVAPEVTLPALSYDPEKP